MTLKDIWMLFKETMREWTEDKVPRLGAALAYYTIFSMAPLLIIAVAMAGLVFGQEAAEGEIVRQFHGLVGRQGAEFIETLIESGRRSAAGLTVIGITTLLFGALGAFSQLQDALDTIWGVALKPGRGLGAVLENRLISCAMVLGVGFLLLVSLVMSAGLSALGHYLELAAGLDILIRLVNLALSFAVPFVLFALIFKFLPDVKIAWGDVWIGAALTAVLFTIGKILIGLYLGDAGVTSVYGAAGSFVILLVWIYYSAQILFFGAEFTQVYMKRHGSGRIVPTENAVPLTEAARAQQGIPHAEVVQALAQDANKQRSDGHGRLDHAKHCH